ncbi:MAG: hypothetical protein ACI90V_012641 [Bacillariaceae sp.]|jgi:hypothetical protein
MTTTFAYFFGLFAYINKKYLADRKTLFSLHTPTLSIKLDGVVFLLEEGGQFGLGASSQQSTAVQSLVHFQFVATTRIQSAV